MLSKPSATATAASGSAGQPAVLVSQNIAEKKPIAVYKIGLFTRILAIIKKLSDIEKK